MTVTANREVQVWRQVSLSYSFCCCCPSSASRFISNRSFVSQQIWLIPLWTGQDPNKNWHATRAERMKTRALTKHPPLIILGTTGSYVGGPSLYPGTDTTAQCQLIPAQCLIADSGGIRLVCGSSSRSLLRPEWRRRRYAAVLSSIYKLDG